MVAGLAIKQTTVVMLLSGLGRGETATSGYCVVAGTTASGKSTLAVALAERVGGVVVNADSIQLYRSLPKLTAQPTAADRERARHRLYGILADQESCSVARWLDLAVAAINATQPQLAIVVGGTGFYLEALLKGLVDVPATPPLLRQAMTARFEVLGAAAFAVDLARRDPALATRGLPQDPQRLLRAAEVLELTGRSITSFTARRLAPTLPTFRGGLALALPADRTRTRVERRLDAMIDDGALEELDAWRRSGDWALSPLAKADGVKELGAYLDGQTTLAAARAATAAKVRRYAKRQRTWLRHRLADLEVSSIPGEELASSLGGSIVASHRTVLGSGS